MPAETPVTVPMLLTEATGALDDDHTPPGVEFVNTIVAPRHTDESPTEGGTLSKVLTVMMLVAEVLPQELVTV